MFELTGKLLEHLRINVGDIIKTVKTLFAHGLEKSTYQRFFDETVKEFSTEEIAELKNFMLRRADRLIVNWNRDFRILARKITTAMSLGELREIKNEFVKLGVDIF